MHTLKELKNNIMKIEKKRLLLTKYCRRVLLNVAPASAQTLAPTIRAAERDTGYKYWFSAPFADSGQAWAADSTYFVFILEQMTAATRFNLPLSLHIR